MSKFKRKSLHKTPVTVQGVVVYGSLPGVDEYGKISLGLVITEKQATKVKKYGLEDKKEWAKETGKRVQGEYTKPSTSKEGEPDGNTLLKIRRNPEIMGNKIIVPVFDLDGNRLDIDKIPTGSKVQVKAYLYLSSNAKGSYARLEPMAVRVLELAESVSSTEWDDEDDDDFASAPEKDTSGGESYESDSDDDDEELV